ncbi:MAG: hypothetical protein JO232_05250 [Verrucomicrobia bacterium]|nr:hypothetical protein [Verrucomicrobiota bacterium]
MNAPHEIGNTRGLQAAHDVWIERYLIALEAWRINSDGTATILYHMRSAWAAYGEYRATADLSFRWSAWHAIQHAAAAFAHLPQPSELGSRLSPQ